LETPLPLAAFRHETLIDTIGFGFETHGRPNLTGFAKQARFNNKASERAHGFMQGGVVIGYA